MRRQAEEDAAVDVGAPRKKPTLEGPPFDRTARDVAGADRKPSRPPSALHDRVQVFRKVRTVGVHLHEQLRAIFQPDPERVFVRTAQPKLARPVQNPHPLIGGSQTIRQGAGAVGRTIVDDQDVVPKAANAGHHSLQVLQLVIGWQDHKHPIGHGRARNLTLTTWRNMSSELRTAMTLVGAEFRQTTGTSAIRTPFFLARYRTSGSSPKPSVVKPAKTSRAMSPRNNLKPHCVSQMPGSRTAWTMRLKALPMRTR